MKLLAGDEERHRRAGLDLRAGTGQLLEHRPGEEFALTGPALHGDGEPEAGKAGSRGLLWPADEVGKGRQPAGPDLLADLRGLGARDVADDLDGARRSRLAGETPPLSVHRHLDVLDLGL